MHNIQRQRIKGCVCIFLDALDEYSGTDEEIARFAPEISSHQKGGCKWGLRIRVCVASRPNTAFTSLRGGHACITIQEWTKHDIDRYATDRLKGCNRKGTDIPVAEITKAASGVFLWVKLVLDRLWQSLCDGRPIDTIMELLSKVPSDLLGFYRHMVESVAADDRPIMMCMLELAIALEYGRRPFRPHIDEFCLIVELLQQPRAKAQDVGLAAGDIRARLQDNQSSHTGLLGRPPRVLRPPRSAHSPNSQVVSQR